MARKRTKRDYTDKIAYHTAKGNWDSVEYFKKRQAEVEAEQEPKVTRYYFEEEDFEYAKGGVVKREKVKEGLYKIYNKKTGEYLGEIEKEMGGNRWNVYDETGSQIARGQNTLYIAITPFEIKVNEGKELYEEYIKYMAKGGSTYAGGGEIKYSKDGYVKEVRDWDGKIIKELVVNGKKYRRNSVYGTYNSIEENELLHKNDYKSGSTYAKGGLTDKEKESLRKVGYTKTQIEEADKRARKGSKFAETSVNPLFNTYAEGGEIGGYRIRGYETEDYDNESDIDYVTGSKSDAINSARQHWESGDYDIIVVQMTEDEEQEEIIDPETVFEITRSEGEYEYSKGGKVRTNSKQVREAVRQHILESVTRDDEYFDNIDDASEYVASEFKRVADYPNNMARIPNHQERFSDYLMGLPHSFYYFYDDMEEFLNGLGINPEGKKYSNDQMQKLYHYLIWKEVSDKYYSYAKGGKIETQKEIDRLQLQLDALDEEIDSMGRENSASALKKYKEIQSEIERHKKDLSKPYARGGEIGEETIDEIERDLGYPADEDLVNGEIWVSWKNNIRNPKDNPNFYDYKQIVDYSVRYWQYNEWTEDSDIDSDAYAWEGSWHSLFIVLENIPFGAIKEGIGTLNEDIEKKLLKKGLPSNYLVLDQLDLEVAENIDSYAGGGSIEFVEIPNSADELSRDEVKTLYRDYVNNYQSDEDNYESKKRSIGRFASRHKLPYNVAEDIIQKGKRNIRSGGYFAEGGSIYANKGFGGNRDLFDKEISLAKTRQIAKEVVDNFNKNLHRDTWLEKGSKFSLNEEIEQGSFDLDIILKDGKVNEYDGGSYAIMKNGDVVNFAVSTNPIAYNYKTKDFQYYADGGEVYSAGLAGEELTKEHLGYSDKEWDEFTYDEKVLARRITRKDFIRGRKSRERELQAEEESKYFTGYLSFLNY